jgi:bifunctional enzyme CysN/CysC
LRIGTRELTAMVDRVEHRLDLDTLQPVPATQLQRGQIGDCDLELSASIPAAAYRARGGRGGFVLFDPRSNEPVGVGLVRVALRRAQNPRGQSLGLGGAARAARLGQAPCVVWLTGPSGASRTMLASHVETDLLGRGHHTYILDGDSVRHGLNRDLGVSDADRVESIRRVAEVARLIVDAGLIVIVCTRFASEREMAQTLFEPDQFFEVQVDATAELSIPEAAHAVLAMLQSRGVLTPD